MSPICVEYIWIDANNQLRGKTKVMHSKVNYINDLPDWNFDGSSTGQSSGEDSEIIIQPRTLFNDPFRGHHHKLVLCDTYTPLGTPLSNNHRVKALDIFLDADKEEPWFGLEQEYFLLHPETNLPLGFDETKT